VKETGHSNPFFEAAGSCCGFVGFTALNFRGFAIGGDAFSSERPVFVVSGEPTI
jgi:hypothetical protein